MHSEIDKAAREAGIDLAKLHAIMAQLATPAEKVNAKKRNWDTVNIPKPNGTRERRKKERMNKKNGRNMNRRR